MIRAEKLGKKCVSDESLRTRRNFAAPPSPDSNNPPPVPERPVSYTPSNSDVLAGGMLGADSPTDPSRARHYGSAAENLNNMGVMHDLLSDVSKPLLNNCERSPGPPPRKLHSQTNRNKWDPNINFPEGEGRELNNITTRK